jgi:hypothetical protein
MAADIYSPVRVALTVSVALRRGGRARAATSRAVLTSPTPGSRHNASG